MARAPLVLFVLAAGGCQTFVGIDDVAGHLPHVDGEYLIGLKRVRADGVTTDTIRLRGTATLDPDTRTLALALAQLAAADGAVVSENAISGLEFPDDATEVDFQLSIEIRPTATEPATDAGDSQVNATMRMRLEGDYALCAVPVGGGLPTIGSILVESATATPPKEQFSTECDGL
ncbi:MAG: hypothetical protein IPL61_15000 [Myxococcales bacterium]|nr:hypothetical protein [Myxococcales bacterium]